LSMLGSLNPITHGHVHMITEARRALLDADVCGDRFDAIIALVSVNKDRFVARKLTSDKQHLVFTECERLALINAATSHLPWCFTAERIDGMWTCDFGGLKRMFSGRVEFVE
jgi:phosphopantetheine adenylyltransferase